MKKRGSGERWLSARPAATVWGARAVVALVCFFNLTAAIPFVLNPALYSHSFQVQDCGIGGQVLVRGLGIAFLMWQVPFIPVIWRPERNRTCFLCLLGMQLIGLIGESWMLVAMPEVTGPLRATGWRFILFDGGGLLGMTLAYRALWGPLRTSGAV